MYGTPFDGLYQIDPTQQGGATGVEQPQVPTVKLNVKGEIVEKPYNDPEIIERLQKEFAFEKNQRDLKERETQIQAELDRMRSEADFWRTQAAKQQAPTPPPQQPTPDFRDQYGIEDPTKKLAWELEQLRQENRALRGDLDTVKNDHKAEEAERAFHEAIDEEVKQYSYASLPQGKEMIASRMLSRGDLELTPANLARTAREVENDLKAFFEDSQKIPAAVKALIVTEALAEKDKQRTQTAGAQIKGAEYMPPPPTQNLTSEQKREQAEQFFRGGDSIEIAKRFLESRQQ